MADPTLKKIAREALKVCRQGWYENEERKLPLISAASWPDELERLDFDAAMVVGQPDFEDFRARLSGLEISDLPMGSVALMDVDPLLCGALFGESGRTTLVLSDADPLVPGGGFEKGAEGPEQTLCRCTTLSRSLRSRDARAMYRQNQEQKAAGEDFFNGYLVISPSVCAFRFAVDYSFLPDPYSIAVASVPAPTPHQIRAHEDGVEQVKAQLRDFLLTAAAFGYRRLVLGDWGCSRGLDPRQVAQWFHTLLVDEGLARLFDGICFALPDPDEHAVFEEVLGADALTVTRVDLTGGSCRMEEDSPEFPACNYTEDITADNLGYIRSHMADGTPFVAELYLDEGDAHLSVLFPYEYAATGEGSGVEIGPFGTVQANPQEDNEDDKLVPLHYIAVGGLNNAVLDVGMLDLGMESDFEPSLLNVEKLQHNGLLEFTGVYANGAVFYRTDGNGRELIRVDVSLMQNGEEVAVSPLHFEPFIQKSPGCIIPFRPREPRE